MEPHVGHAVNDDEATEELGRPCGQFERDHAAHGEPDYVGRHGRLLAQHNGDIPRKLCDGVGPVAPLGPAVPP